MLNENSPNISEMFSLTGRCALVTGASKGIGWAIAQALAAAGADVTLAARNVDTLDERVSLLKEQGYSASRLAFDVADETAAMNAVNRVAEKNGKLDILVNNAGIVHRRMEVTELETNDWKRIQETNVTACFVLSREAAKWMRKNEWGRIINIASVLGITGRSGTTPYTSSKYGLIGLTRVLSADLGQYGVTANVIAPGFIATDLNAAMWQDPKVSKTIADRTSLGRWGKPADIGGAALFLASPAATYVTGHVLVVDGGMTATLHL